MNKISLLLIPSAALILSSCAGPVGPAGPGYAGGPSTVYVEGSDHRDRDDQYHHNVTDVNQVDVNRTNINERTVNQTNVDKTNITDRNVKNTKIASKNVKKKVVSKPVEKKDENQQGNPQS